MIKPQTVEFIKGLAALFFFFLVLGGTVFLRWKEKIGPKLTGILLMGMLAIMGVLLGVVIDWQTLTARKVNSNSNSGEIICAHGLKIRAIDSQQQYLADGDFKVVYTYDVQNTSPVHIRYLVPDRAGWFGLCRRLIRSEPVCVGSGYGRYSLALSVGALGGIGAAGTDGTNR